MECNLPLAIHPTCSGCPPHCLNSCPLQRRQGPSGLLTPSARPRARCCSIRLHLHSCVVVGHVMDLSGDIGDDDAPETYDRAAVELRNSNVRLSWLKRRKSRDFGRIKMRQFLPTRPRYGDINKERCILKVTTIPCCLHRGATFARRPPPTRRSRTTARAVPRAHTRRGSTSTGTGRPDSARRSDRAWGTRRGSVSAG